MHDQRAGWRLPAWVATAAASLGLLVYVFQAWIFAHTNIPGLDEGAYLYKGYLFATGEYRPFGPGILTNKAPLAFLIPGYAQLLLGAGLRTGRMYALAAGLLVVAGTYLAARRLTNPWLAAGSIWAFALSPMVIKIYSGAVTEALVAGMLAWMLYFSVGEGRRNWHLIAGAGLASLMVLTRQNMAPVLPALILYLAWEHGWSAIRGPLFIAVGILVLGHALFWPNILQVWAPWLPAELTPLLDAFRPPAGVSASWNPVVDWIGRTGAFFEGLRHHLIIIVSSAAAIILFRRRAGWSSSGRYRAVVFLAALYFGLLFLHAWGAVGSSYEFFSCVYCFTPYLSFFAPAGILLGVLSIGSWEHSNSGARALLACIFVIVLFGGVAFSAFEDIGGPLLRLPFPRIREGAVLPGLTSLGDTLSNSASLAPALARKAVSLGAGIISGAVIISLAYIVWRRRGPAATGYAAQLMGIILVLSLMLAPLLAGAASRPDCKSDVIALNEEVGYHLSGIIPAGSLIYWDGGLSVVPMLYLPGRDMFPPQINSGYSYVQGGDPQQVLRFGYWNAALQEEWLAEADFLLVEEQRYDGWKPRLTPDRYSEYARTPVGTSCRDGTRLRLFKRLNSSSAAPEYSRP